MELCDVKKVRDKELLPGVRILKYTIGKYMVEIKHVVESSSIVNIIPGKGSSLYAPTAMGIVKDSELKLHLSFELDILTLEAVDNGSFASGVQETVDVCHLVKNNLEAFLNGNL